MKIQNNNSTSFQMKVVPQAEKNKEKLIRGLNLLTKRNGKKHYDLITKKVERITNKINGEIIISEAKNPMGFDVSTIEIKTPENIHYKTYKDGSPVIISANSFLRGPSGILAKACSLLNDNEKGSKLSDELNDIFMKQVIKERDAIIGSKVNKKI